MTTVPDTQSEPSTSRADDATDHPAMSGLRRLNLVFGLLHLGSAILMLTLSNDFALPVTTTFLDDMPGGAVDAQRLTNQFELRLGWGTAAFLLLSAGFHFLIASPVGYQAYCREITRNRNRFRWVEYSLSASLMIVLIAMLVGISDAAALIAIAGVNASMILFGWLMETTNDLTDRSVSWTPFWFGSLAGAVPWVAVGVYLFGPGGNVPGFVYVIFFTIFVFFNCFAVNQVLQYARVGPWRRYEFGERVYVWLSISAKSALAWQIFANTLV